MIVGDSEETEGRWTQRNSAELLQDKVTWFK
jgi:hypothetical protein